jgi:hypothetical protein
MRKGSREGYNAETGFCEPAGCRGLRHGEDYGPFDGGLPTRLPRLRLIRVAPV